MRSFVFTDKALERQAGRFVWLSVDTEKEKNASFLTRYKVEAWPTFWIVDPKTEKVALRWMGGATVPQLEKILDDGARAVKGGASGGVEEALAEADRLFAENRNAESVASYRAALAKAPAGWPQYGRATESLLFALQRVRNHKECATTAKDAFSRLEKTPSAANVAGSGLSCALELPAADPDREALLKTLLADAHAVVADKTTKLAADDVSSVYETLVDERDRAKDEDGKKKAAADWAAFLEGKARAAKTKEGRAVFDPHRLSAYLEMGAPEKAIPMLQESEKDFPGDYNPPARLAIAYNDMKRWDDALAATDRALARVYGPRKLRVYAARADAFTGKGDVAGAKKTTAEALAFAQSLPAGQRNEGAIASLRKKLEAMP
jgi:tetratricopeptide (TPR) repeat protein